MTKPPISAASMSDRAAPRLLAIEASADACSVALAFDGVVIERNELTPRQHSQLLLPMVDDLLQQSALALRDIDVIAYSAGPGSFTGLRLALGVAQGLAFGADIPLIGVSSLAALAQAVIEARGLEARELREGYCVMCAVDARMGEYYVGRYIVRHGLACAEADDRLLAPADVVLVQDASHDCILAGNLSAQPPFSSHAWQAIDSSVALARHLIPLARVKWLAGEYTAAELALPVYLRGKSGWKSLQG